MQRFEIAALNILALLVQSTKLDTRVRAREKKKSNPAAREINIRLLRCNDSREVCEMIERRAAEFDCVNVSTAFRKLLQVVIEP